MSHQTNTCATQMRLDGSDITQHSRLHSWQPTTKEWMRKFGGLLAWMGLVQFPTISNYWSKSFLYKNEVAPNSINRNWLELMFQMWHFFGNEECPLNDILHKIQTLTDT
jgi:hypothetical protein